MNSLQRLKSELQRMQRRPLTNLGCTIGLFDEKNLYRWKATFLGPQDSPYNTGLFFIELMFPDDYPMNAPQIRFLTPIYHLNICPYNYSFGLVYPSFIHNWNPSTTPEDILSKLYTIFYLHNPDSAFNPETANEYRYNKYLYELKAAYFTKKYADMNSMNSYIDEIGNQNWDFSCDEKYLTIFTKPEKPIIKYDMDYDKEKFINVSFHVWKEDIKLTCQLKEKTEHVIKRFLEQYPAKYNCEPLVIYNGRKLKTGIPIGYLNNKNFGMTVIDISGVAFY